PQPGLAFIAFVDGLWERGYLKEISWQEEPQDLVANLQPMIERALPGQFDWSWLNYAVWEDQTTDLLLRAIGARLYQQGYLLVSIDMDTDTYPVFLVPAAQWDACRRLALQAGLSHLECLVGPDC
ncbi:MAG: hypothetical protein VB089_06035, partial [Anaerolineaceae bacterium]|nr:hypothetical protein [Anaerolineaceae bacterium]